MIDPFAIILKPKDLFHGLYESFYFRGNSLSGKLSFWLKHNLLLFKNAPTVRLEGTFVLFDRLGHQCTTLHSEQTLERELFFKEIEGRSWSDFHMKMDNGCYFHLSSTELEGSLSEKVDNRLQKIQWQFHLNRSQRSYFHLSPHWLYSSPIFPKKRLLTSEIDLQFQGSITLDGRSLTDPSEVFVGMNGHNWGREHAAIYAYGNCNQFHESPRSPFSKTYFDGYSAKIRLPGGKFLSPFLSGASLMVDGQWHHFNQLTRTTRHQIHRLDSKQWSATFHNATHTLKVDIEGSDALWVELPYDHPDRKRSLICNTKFAKGRVALLKRSGAWIREFTSDLFELETLTEPSCELVPPS